MDRCPKHPEKVRKSSFVEAVDGLLARLEQPFSRIKRAYKCEDCWHWHYTSKNRPWHAPRDPFPRAFAYGVVVSDRKVWQSNDQSEAERYARRVGGEVVPFMHSHHHMHKIRKKHSVLASQ